MSVAIENEDRMEREKILKEIIILINILDSNNRSVQWSSLNKMNSEIIIEHNSLVKYINQFSNVEDIHKWDFNEYPFFNMIYGSKFNFKNLLLNLHRHDSKNELYQKLSFLSVIGPIQNTVNRIYHNAKFEPSLIFLLFESIMNEEDPDDKSKKEEPCKCCGHQKNRGIGKRIGDFFDKVKLSETAEALYRERGVKVEDFIKIAKEIANVRHSFFHTKDEKSMEYYSIKIMEGKTQEDDHKSITLKEDLKHGDGTLIGQRNLRFFITHFLLNKLLTQN